MSMLRMEPSYVLCFSGLEILAVCFISSLENPAAI